MRIFKTLAVVVVMLAMFVGTAQAQQLVEASLFGGYYSGQTGDWSYYGAGGAIFPLDFASDVGRVRLGPSAEYVGWSGTVDQKVHFDGYKAVGGMEGQLLTDQTKTALKLRYGFKKGNAGISEAGIDIAEDNTLMNVDLTHQEWWDQDYFGRFLVQARADIDLGGSKTTKGTSGDPRTDQTEYGLAGQLDIVRGSAGFLFGGLSWNHCNSNNQDSEEVSLGVRLFKEILEVRGSRLFRNGNNAWGIGVVVNLHHLFGQ